ncbi:hypothetical protein LJC30_01025 [Odoribacter sp. OttesenSCG-928-L07]|nr:hypothetical protein [Odoribacter sp. OttesenSCG-928-L07]MDL2239521.1 hypothetical protein [Bacteroidales bacterium OttesenSCG-928-L14]
MKKVYIISILFLISFASTAQNISLTFNVENASGKHIYLTKYSDYITEMDEIVFSSIIPENGIVKCEISAVKTESYKILINYAEENIFLEPNSSYTINVAYPKVISNINPFQNKQYLILNVVSSNKHDVNKLINDFNVAYDDFLLEKLNFLSPKNILKEHEKFKQEYLKKNSNKFYTTYVEYSCGLTEISLVDKVDKSFIDKYFTNKEVAYNSHEYFSLLKEVCKHSEYILNDSTSNNLRLKEVAYLYTLLRDYFGDFSKDEVLNLIKSFTHKAKYTESKFLGNNIQIYLTRYRKGSYLPTLDLESEVGKKYDITQSGKKIYLFFYNSNVEICGDIIKEIESLDLESKYSVSPIFIPLDFDVTTIFPEKSLVLIPKDIAKTHIDLNIRNYPFAILVDNKGKILRYNAPVTNAQLLEYLKLKD